MINSFTKTAAMLALPLLVATSGSYATEVKLGGYVKADAIYDIDEKQGDLSFSRGLTTGDAADDTEGGFRIHARESRINLTVTDQDSPSFKAVIEGDFFVGTSNELVSNSDAFRLRHAYGQLGNVMIGQNWSTFMDFMTYPKILDFGTAPGVSFIRQAQVRFTTGGLSLALENPETRIAGVDSSEDPLPDFVIKYRYEGDAFGFYAAGLAKQIEGTLAGDTESTSAAALHAGVVFKFGTVGRLGLNVIAGEPGRYQQEKWAFPDAIIVDGDIEAIESTSFQLTYKHQLANGSFNISYAELEIDDEYEAEIAALGAFETVSEFHINYIWNASKHVEYGAEVSFAEREEFNGDDGDNTRLQFSAKYKF